MFFTPVEGKSNKAMSDCDTCRNEYSFSGGSTSNLSSHMRKKHPSLANGHHIWIYFFPSACVAHLPISGDNVLSCGK